MVAKIQFLKISFSARVKKDEKRNSSVDGYLKTKLNNGDCVVKKVSKVIFAKSTHKGGRGFMAKSLFRADNVLFKRSITVIGDAFRSEIFLRENCLFLMIRIDKTVPGVPAGVMDAESCRRTIIIFEKSSGMREKNSRPIMAFFDFVNLSRLNIFSCNDHLRTIKYSCW